MKIMRHHPPLALFACILLAALFPGCQTTDPADTPNADPSTQRFAQLPVEEALALEIALTEAAWKGEAEEVERLLQAGADPEGVSGRRARRYWQAVGQPPARSIPGVYPTPLLACLHSYIPEGEAGPAPGARVQITQALLKAGADPNRQARFWFGQFPLLSAVECGNVEAVILLLEAGADIKMTLENMPVFDVPSGPDTALQQAVEQRDAQLVRILLAAGASPLEGVLHKTPVYAAASNPEMLALLLDELVATDANPRWGHVKLTLQTALSRTLSEWTSISARLDSDGAFAEDCATCFRMLTDFGAVLDLDDVGIAFHAEEIEDAELEAWYLHQLATREPAGLFASYWLAGLVDEQDIDGLRDALEAGLDVNAKGEDGRTALHFAVFEDDVELVAFLLESGAWVNAHDDDGETALAWSSDERVIAVLREAGGVYSDNAAE
ncbi:ankyrin repeat domain-containing protein [Phycisphaeraceae bacterium D3-23]